MYVKQTPVWYLNPLTALYIYFPGTKINYYSLLSAKCFHFVCPKIKILLVFFYIEE